MRRTFIASIHNLKAEAKKERAGFPDALRPPLALSHSHADNGGEAVKTWGEVHFLIFQDVIILIKRAEWNPAIWFVKDPEYGVESVPPIHLNCL